MTLLALQPLLSLPVASLGVPFSLVVPGRPPPLPLPLPHGTQRCKLDPGRRCRRRRRQRTGGRARPRGSQAGIPSALYTPLAVTKWDSSRRCSAFRRRGGRRRKSEITWRPPSICTFPVVRLVLCDVALTLISFPSACNL